MASECVRGGLGGLDWAWRARHASFSLQVTDLVDLTGQSPDPRPSTRPAEAGPGSSGQPLPALPLLPVLPVLLVPPVLMPALLSWCRYVTADLLSRRKSTGHLGQPLPLRPTPCWVPPRVAPRSPAPHPSAAENPVGHSCRPPTRRRAAGPT